MMNKKLLIVLLLILNTLLLFLISSSYSRIEEYKNQLLELNINYNNIIENIEKKGDMKNCSLFSNSIPIFNPNIFNTDDFYTSSIDIYFIKDDKYGYCYTKNEYEYLLRIKTTAMYKKSDKNKYIFLKKIVMNKNCSNSITLTNRHSYCVKEDYILYK